MAITIPDEILRLSGLSEGELLLELALLLFQKEKLTLVQASRLARMTLIEFQKALASRKIPLHYGIDEFHEDLQTLRGAEIM